MSRDHLLDQQDPDQVTGGNDVEMADDARFLNVLLRGLPGQPDRIGAHALKYDNPISIHKELCDAWQPVRKGVSARNWPENKYMDRLNRRKITRAGAHTETVAGRHPKKKDWQW